MDDDPDNALTTGPTFSRQLSTSLTKTFFEIISLLEASLAKDSRQRSACLRLDLLLSWSDMNKLGETIDVC